MPNMDPRTSGPCTRGQLILTVPRVARAASGLTALTRTSRAVAALALILATLAPGSTRAQLTVTPTNLELAASQFDPILVDGGLVAFLVSESRQNNTDLNGDGDTVDSVLHVFDAATGTTTNLGLAVSSFPPFDVDGDLVAFSVSESDQGDLNGDGDTSDPVLHVFDAATGMTTNVELAFSTLGNFDGGRVAFAVSESGQGGTILNGDGDTNDNVLHVFDAATGTTTNLGLAASFGRIVVDGTLVAFLVSESGQGGTNLNSDGDSNDAVVHVFDAAAGVTTNLGLAAAKVDLDGGLLAFAVSESGQGDEGGTDLNSDGDSGDLVVHVAVLDTSNTPEGPDVVVELTDETTGTVLPVEVTFFQVTQAGTTSLTSSSMGPSAPSGFQAGDPPTYFDLTTTASFTGPATVCLDYSEIVVDEANLQLFHFEDPDWVNITSSLDTVNDIICGTVSSFSQFAIFESEPGLPALISQVASLELNAGQKHSLTRKLEAAERSIARGNDTAASNQLRALINEVQVFNRSGLLRAPPAALLIAEAQAIIDQL